MYIDQTQAWELSDLSCIRVAGADAIKVLNGLCTAKLVDLKPGAATEALFTDDRGRVMAHGIMGLQPDQKAVWFAGFYAEPSKLVAHIDRFIFREDAIPQDMTENLTRLLIDGQPAWSAVCQELQLTEGDAQQAVCPIQIEDRTGWAIAAPICSPDAKLCLVPRESGSDFQLRLLKANIGLGTADELESRRVGNFWPKAPHEITDRTLPQELDRDAQAISFTKGCYLGQETVARLDAMGEVQRKLCLVQFDGSAKMVVGQSLVREAKEVGKLTSIAPLAVDGKRFALASMRRGSMAVGSLCELVSPEHAEPVPGIVIAHP